MKKFPLKWIRGIYDLYVENNDIKIHSTLNSILHGLPENLGHCSNTGTCTQIMTLEWNEALHSTNLDNFL